MPRKTHLNTAAVVAAAADLVNAEGPAALSLSRLAAELGVRTPSLYNHVDGLPGLGRELARLSARGLAERLSGAAVGRSGPEALDALCQAYRDHIKAAPGLYLSTLRASGAQAPADPELQREEQRSLDVCLAVASSFGLKGKDALHAVRALRSAVHGFATLEIAGGFGLPLDCDESFRRLVGMLARGLAAGGA
jgi:AcrR family transcriptional regulator